MTRTREALILVALVCQCLLNCMGQTTPAPASDAGPRSSADANDAVVGSPCAVNQIGDCEIQACWFPGAAPDMVSKRPINDAGPDACEGIVWP